MERLIITHFVVGYPQQGICHSNIYIARMVAHYYFKLFRIYYPLFLSYGN